MTFMLPEYADLEFHMSLSSKWITITGKGMTADLLFNHKVIGTMNVAIPLLSIVVASYEAVRACGAGVRHNSTNVCKSVFPMIWRLH